MSCHVVPFALQEYNLNDYKEIDAIHDYKNLCIQFGNLSLFVAAVPFLPLLACFKNFVEIRVDGWKLVTGFRCNAMQWNNVMWFDLI